MTNEENTLSVSRDNADGINRRFAVAAENTYYPKKIYLSSEAEKTGGI
ncbi:MAG: hypothetical protein SOR79_04615 [Blautia sp.]|nr:hypothetical protein [Blautia sp.]MDY3016419.1 hypothetical protein [Blautia sp.]